MNTEERKAEEYANMRMAQTEGDDPPNWEFFSKRLINIMKHAFLAGYSSKQSELEAVIRELVELKNIHDTLEAMTDNERSAFYNMANDYKKRKPLAWEAARKSLQPKE